MQRFYFFLILLLLIGRPAWSAAAAPGEAARLTAATTEFLRRYVDAQGAVDYAALQRAPQPLYELLQTVGTFDAQQVSVADRTAFYLNAYNLLVIGAVVAHYPTASVIDVPGFFTQERHLVGREMLTLDELEHSRLRRLIRDPLLHFALVRGTRGCPPLRRAAYTGAHLRLQLADQARVLLLDPAYVRVGADGRSVALPELFRWFRPAFGRTAAATLAFLNAHRDGQPVPGGCALRYYGYDWRLNEQHPAADVAALGR